MITTGSTGNGTKPYRGDIVKKDMKAKAVKGRAVKPAAVVNKVKSALKAKKPMIIAIATKKGKK